MHISVVTDPGGASVLSETVGLTPTSTGCTSTLASTNCTLNVDLAAGSYDAVISTYDASNAELSAGQDINFTIVAGHANQILFTLSGIPAAIRVASASPAVHGAQDSGFTLYGVGAQKFAAEALDADGNVIVGVGSPTFSVAAVGGSGFTVTAPATTTPNTFALSPPGNNGQGATVTVTAAYGDGTCSTAGAVCSTNFTVKNDVQTLFVQNGSNNRVDMYTQPYTGAPVQITNGMNGPVSIALDPTGRLFVSNVNGRNVNVYAPPYTGAPIASAGTGVLGEPSALAVDKSGYLFVADVAYGVVDVFTPPYSGAPITISNGISFPCSLAIDDAGNLYIGDTNNQNVGQYMPPFTASSAPTLTMSTGVPQQLAFDRTGNLFVLNGTNVDMFAPPYTGAGTTITSGMNSPFEIALNGTGALFTANDDGSIAIDNAPYTAAAQLIDSVPDAAQIVLDGTGTLLVDNANGAGSGLYLFAPPFTGAPTIITTGSWSRIGTMILSP
jgi:hypothetical protein